MYTVFLKVHTYLQLTRVYIYTAVFCSLCNFAMYVYVLYCVVTVYVPHKKFTYRSSSTIILQLYVPIDMIHIAILVQLRTYVHSSRVLPLDRCLLLSFILVMCDMDYFVTAYHDYCIPRGGES